MHPKPLPATPAGAIAGLFDVIGKADDLLRQAVQVYQ